MPVTHGVTGSSPVRTAKANKKDLKFKDFRSFFIFPASAKYIIYDETIRLWVFFKLAFPLCVLF